MDLSEINNNETHLPVPPSTSPSLGQEVRVEDTSYNQGPINSQVPSTPPNSAASIDVYRHEVPTPSSIRGWIRRNESAYVLTEPILDELNTIVSFIRSIHPRVNRDDIRNFIITMIYEFLDLPRMPRFLTHYYTHSSPFVQAFISIVNDILRVPMGHPRFGRYMIIVNYITNSSSFPFTPEF